ncbi:hypothetical protein [Xenorhabdus bovienii]|uniref:RES domain-containing protein n=1 Tax=Xenorhabdus bovienii str. feltiae Moldova TaxID=1398200 RepID=A0A077NCR4_XENBV|nr:hypothetical protein [Xenorhabdus bovienii]CDG99962.1 hypothetical protein XBFM1_1260111 [Xenorhabdus bovienii str. feltiae Moldova]
MNFDVFDEDIDEELYYQYFRSLFFPNSTATSIDCNISRPTERTYRKGAVLNRVRRINPKDIKKFMYNDIKIDEFFPPQPNKIHIPSGRLNSENQSIIYMADNCEVAMSECNIVKEDYFLLINLEIKKDMRFLEVGCTRGETKLSNCLFNLMNTQDKRFYGLITRIFRDFFDYYEHNGIIYNSTRIEKSNPTHEGGKFNFAIKGNNRKSLQLKSAFLMHLGNDEKLYPHVLYEPLSKKKKNRLKIKRFTNNKKQCDKLIDTHGKKIIDGQQKNKMLLKKEEEKTHPDILFKIFEK